MVEYDLASYGFVCVRGKGAKAWNPMQALYVRAGLVGPTRTRAILHAARPDLQPVS